MSVSRKSQKFISEDSKEILTVDCFISFDGSEFDTIQEAYKASPEYKKMGEVLVKNKEYGGFNCSTHTTRVFFEKEVQEKIEIETFKLAKNIATKFRNN